MASHKNGSKAAAAASKSSKIKQITEIASRLASCGPTIQQIDSYAENLIDPRHADPVVMPSPTPARAGVAKFPLVVEVETANDFGVIIQPDFTQPLVIFEGAGAAETVDRNWGTFVSPLVAGAGPSELINDVKGIQNCPVIAETIEGYQCLPYLSTDGCTLDVKLTVEARSRSSRCDVQFLGYNGQWVVLGTTGSLQSVGTEQTLSGITWSSSYTHYTFRQVYTYIDEVKYSFTMNPTSGTSTCAPLGSPTVGSVREPDWGLLLSASTRARIVACDCLVTFEGSNLQNGGSIAVCNSDDDLPIRNSFYETIASQPFDMYRGRLASTGESEGGGHWHYVPDTPSSFEMYDLSALADSDLQSPRGYFGVKGKATGEVVRIECHFIVNFFSTDPSYNMQITPCFSEFPRFLFSLRDLVPLVSSNDSHLMKLKRLGKSAGKGLLKSGKFVKDHDAEIAKALGLMATLL